VEAARSCFDYIRRVVPSTSEPAKVLLLDGHSLAFRAFYALPQELRTSTGQQTNAVYGFTSMLIKALQDEKTQYVAVAFDSGLPKQRLAIRPEYKATRTTPPDEFRQQLGLIREVLHVLKVPVFEVENVEADDILAVAAEKLSREGHEVILVTADRDFFQCVSPRVRLMMNRRGISDTVVYDEAAVRQRFGFGPEKYLEYAALRGDPSDNIAGVAGVGEKTAAQLVQTYGSLEEIFAHLEDLAPRIRAGLGEAQGRLLENREFFRLRSAEELSAEGTPIPDISLEELRIGEWDLSEVRKLFDALEFRTLFERLAEVRPLPAEISLGFEVDCVDITTSAELKRLVQELSGSEVLTVRVGGEPDRPRDPPDWLSLVTPSGAAVVRIGDPLEAAAVWKGLRPLVESSGLMTHGSKSALLRFWAAGIQPKEVATDTEVAAYLLDPARGSYGLDELSRQYLGRELRLESGDEAGQQALSLDGRAATSALGLEAVATAELATLLEKELRDRGSWELFVDLELPLSGVLARLEQAGVKIDVGYLNAMSESISDELRAIEDEIYRHAGEPFNINSPPQLRRVLYEQLGLRPTKRTKTGFSTDASVLESLREEHLIVDAILRYRERSKLKSTYIDALPPLVDPRTGRLHCRFNQTVTTTGRLSSDSPNLQNIPIRTEEGKQIRRAFIPEPGYMLLVADYSQIELRILAHLSEDPELIAAFSRDEDIHRRSIAKALGIGEHEVSPQLRAIGKMVSYGVTYGMGPYGLSQRLRIPVDQARTYIEGFFGLYPKVREYLDWVVARATEDGYTTTILGRRRYLPELKARNARVRSLGERMALNAPIQGSAADIIKLAMVRVDRILGDGPARMVLTVHDELVFEVPSAEVGAVGASLREAMESALELKVPLKVDLSSGANWAEAKH
jgi:DNA polymerase-1